MWDAPHILPDRLYISGSGINSNHTVSHLFSRLESLALPLHLLHPLFQRALVNEIVGLRNPTSCEPIRVRDFCATTDGNTSTDDSFPDEDFFLDIGALWLTTLTPTPTRTSMPTPM
jgi:hypothetical protein